MKQKEITLRELCACLDDLKLTSKQKEFSKAVLIALARVVLQKRFGCKVDI